MKKIRRKKILACLLAAAMLTSLGVLSFAGSGPYTEGSGDWYYGRLELISLGEDEHRLMDVSAPGETEKTLLLFAENKASSYPGAAYDRKTNRLTLTDFRGNYILRANLMGDDFTLCVQGDCRLSRIEMNGGGVMQPKWGGSLRITGDGTLTVNPNKTFDSGVYFSPQAEDMTVLTVDKGVSLSVSGATTAIEAYSCSGGFRMEAGGAAVPIEKSAAVRTLGVSLPGYSNEREVELHLCRSAADPDGIYHMQAWYDDNEQLVNVTVERFLRIDASGLYLQDFGFSDDAGALSFRSLEEAAAAGYTYETDENGEERWMTVDSMGDHHDHDVYRDDDGNSYARGVIYGDDGEAHETAMTIEPIKEIPGEYLFRPAPDVDFDSLRQAEEEREIEGVYDYYSTALTYTFGDGQQENEKLTLSRIDIILDQSAIPWGEPITAQAMFDLMSDGLFAVSTPGVFVKVRRIEEAGTGNYQTLPLTARTLFSDQPFDVFDENGAYRLVLTFGTAYDATAGKYTAFDPDGVTLYVNGEKTDTAAPLKEDVDEMVTAGDVVLSTLTLTQTPDFVPGDVNGDGTVNAEDARYALRAAVGLDDTAEGLDFTKETNRCYRAANVDGEDGVTAADARLILRAAVGLEILG